MRNLNKEGWSRSFEWGKLSDEGRVRKIEWGMLSEKGCMRKVIWKVEERIAYKIV